MEPTSIAAGLVAAKTAQTQMAIAAKMMKMNAETAQSVVALIDASQANLQQLVSAAPGLGGNVDMSV